ncbi:MAG: L-threonylcarbamoyladenylate synthase [Desulfurococcaceae archaeon]
MARLTLIVKTDPFNPDESVISKAVEILRNGGLVAFPTETVYGLGASISRKDAIKKIFSVKGRPMDNPLIVHVDSIDMFLNLTLNPPEYLINALEKLWPGPFTIVYWKSSSVPGEASANLPKAAYRSPAHRVALKLINYLGEAIVAPSANKSGKPSPTTAQHVYSDLGGSIDMIIDAGETLYGIESTIIDFTSVPPRLLRPGALAVEKISEILGIEIEIPLEARGFGEFGEALAPGMKYKHYAPEAELVVVESGDYSDLNKLINMVKKLISDARSKYRSVAVICSSETCSSYLDTNIKIIEIGSRKDIFQIAKNIFKTLRRLDEEKIEFAIVEGFEEKGLGLAVMNRLRKASGGRIVHID